MEWMPHFITYICIFCLGCIGGRILEVVVYGISMKRRTPLVELLMGSICVGTVLCKGFTLLTICLCIYGAILLAISLIDWEIMMIPNSLVLCVLVIAIPFCLGVNDLALWERIIGFLIISVPLFVCSMCINGAFGGGDIKLMAASGLILGPWNSIVAFIIAVLLGSVYAVYLLWIRKVGRRAHMPFGPFLCMGCYTAMLFGEKITTWYLQF